MAMEHDAAAPHILKLARSLFPQQRTFSFTAISVAKAKSRPLGDCLSEARVCVDLDQTEQVSRVASRLVWRTI
jgi:hypothetical protein